MSYASANNVAVTSGVLTVARSGVWHAKLSVDGDDITVFQNTVTLTLGDGASTWTGSLFRGGDAFGHVEMRIVGGGNGLAKQLPGQSYRAAIAKTILADILGGAGETLDATVASSILSTQIPAWTRVAGTASSQLTALVTALGSTLTWRMLSSGTIWLGAEAWPAAPTLDETDIVKLDPVLGYAVLGTTTGYQLLPGMAFQGQNVERVEHSICADALRTTLWFS